MLTNFSTILVSSGSCLLSSPYVTRTYKHLVFTKRIIKLVTRIVSKTTFLVITTVPKWIIRHIGSVLNHIITYSYFVVTYEEDDIASNITTALALGIHVCLIRSHVKVLVCLCFRTLVETREACLVVTLSASGNQEARRVELQPLFDSSAGRWWKGKLTNRNGRLALVNSVITSTVTYFLTAFPADGWMIKKHDNDKMCR